jgi:hypothetical protein
MTEKIVGTKILDIDIGYVTGAVINGAMTQKLQVLVGAKVSPDIGHVDGVIEERIL